YCLSLLALSLASLLLCSARACFFHLSFPTRRSSDLFGLVHFSKRTVCVNSPAFTITRHLPLMFRASFGLAYSTSERQTNPPALLDRKSTRLNSSHVSTSYAVFCLNKKERR